MLDTIKKFMRMKRIFLNDYENENNSKEDD